eukprot:TRINITY_DN264_c0_g1_i1.p1 TRINITY_DN264_c0_g1~~TRINITY_DN264_c0_g1_i1.p1  ORF type:complete len:1166 (-),score=238.85 TRINITY_DN264_c0_g1_i1:27-3524(-)
MKHMKSFLILCALISVAVGDWEPFSSSLKRDIVDFETKAFSFHEKRDHVFGTVELKYNGQFKANTVLLDEEDQISVECHDGHLVFHPEGEDVDMFLQIQAGVYISGGGSLKCANSGEEFYRKVTSVKIDGSILLAETEECKPLDLFKELDVFFENNPLPLSEINNKKRGEYEYENEWDVMSWNYESGSVVDTKMPLHPPGFEPLLTTFNMFCLDCFSASSVGVRFTMKYSLSIWFPYVSFDELNVEVFGDAALNLLVLVESKAPFSRAWEKDLIDELKLPTITFFIAGVPIKITPHFSFSIGAELTIDYANFTVGAAYQQDLDLGMRYLSSTGEFTEYYKNEYNFDVQKPTGFVEGDITFTATPSITIELTSLINAEFAFALTPYIVTDFTVSTSSTCIISTEVNYGLNLEFSLEKISINFLAITEKDLSHKFKLPKSLEYNLFEKECISCGGCLSLNEAEWRTLPWTECGRNCANPQTRVVFCSKNGATVDDSECTGTKPAVSQPCTCPPDPCSAYTNCDECLSSYPNCNWCNSEPVCTSDVQSSTCSGTWTSECEREEPIVATYPTASSVFTQGDTLQITWTGGKTGGNVYIRWRASSEENEWYYVPGITSDPIPNTGSFEWTIPKSFEIRNDIILSISSHTDNRNFYELDPITVEAFVYQFEWDIGEWSSCIYACGGYKSRNVRCRSLEGLLSSDEDCPPPVPARFDTTSCTDSSSICYCKPNTYGFESCVTTESDIYCNMAFCCWACQDPCYDAYWRYTDEGGCSKKCGGGERTYSQVCKSGNGNLYCDSTWCDNGPIGDGWKKTLPNFPLCNTQGCPEWKTEEWKDCSKTCSGGTRSRVVSCVDPSGNIVPNSECTSTKPPTSSSCNVEPCTDFPISVTKPKRGSVFNKGDTIDIQWAGGQQYGTVSIYLEAAESILIASVSNTGQHSFALPDTLGTVSNLKVKVISDANTGLSPAFIVRGFEQYTISLNSDEVVDGHIEIYGSYGSERVNITSSNTVVDILSVGTIFTVKLSSSSNTMIHFAEIESNSLLSQFGFFSDETEMIRANCKLITNQNSCITESGCDWSGACIASLPIETTSSDQSSSDNTNQSGDTSSSNSDQSSDTTTRQSSTNSDQSSQGTSDNTNTQSTTTDSEIDQTAQNSASNIILLVSLTLLTFTI